MNSLFVLENPVKHYAWGSPKRIPRLLGIENPEETPYAELWMGIHREGPSTVRSEQGPVPLEDLIRGDPARYLGPETVSAFGTLPFLFKVLGIAAPLSLQAHPNRAQARAGWERENRLGIPPAHPDRRYKDPNHKPELFCALSRTRILAGFRDPALIDSDVRRFAARCPQPVRAALEDACAALKTAGLRAFFAALHAPAFRDAWARRARHRISRGSISGLAARYPSDPAALAPLYLNALDLRPREAVPIPAGILHCYLSGFGVELMANSDNVLRGGLTTKPVDREALLEALDFAPFTPEVFALPESGGVYPKRCAEFSLRVLRDSPRLCAAGPTIALVTRGRVSITRGSQTLDVRKGAALFIPPAGDALLKGRYTLYAAGSP
ncbi:MAG: mannose-6-phosphate isomerase, class I [Spirochaetaceae bacterium]|jgi:mannose-6-phosphate isomerase|nr:mannose-6-phosphate isomerase, class I [Spirochaetaceae bacterium]